MTARASRLTITAASLDFQNPLLLAAGTAAYGRELAGVIDIDALGGLVTKAVSPEARKGAAAPRVAEFDGGMMNAVGLANPGLDSVKQDDMPWLAAHLRRARVIVNVIGTMMEDFAEVVAGLDDVSRVDAFELNVSCPNVKAGGMEFAADLPTLRELVTRVRSMTRKPIFVKLSPMLSSIADTARCAVDAGADGLTLINTIPGLSIDVESRRPALGFGTGGISGEGLLPVGVLAVWKARQAVNVPIIGVGGVGRGSHAIEYLMAGASLVGMGTAALRDPRSPARVLSELQSWCEQHDVTSIGNLIGTVEWPA